MSYHLRYAGYITAQGPPSPAAWTGPQGPAGTPGPGVVASFGNATLSVAATVGASASGLLATLLDGYAAWVLTVEAEVIDGVDTNYTLEIWDGDPDAGGTMKYQATGITAASYLDSASFFIPKPASSTLWARIENVDPVGTGVNIMIRYQPVFDD